MKIKYDLTSKTVSSSDLVSNYIISIPLPSEVKTAVNAGKDVWFTADAFAHNLTTSAGMANANKKIRIAVKQGAPNSSVGNSVISQFIAIENILGSQSRDDSGSPAVFGTQLVRNAVDPVDFTFRRLEELEYDANVGLRGRVAFFIPE